MEAIPFTLFSSGGYDLSHLPIHLPLILLGVFIRHKLKSRLSQWIWLGLLVLAAAGCEIMWDLVSIWSRLAVCWLCTLVIDLSIGTAVIGIPNTICRFIAWITENNEEPSIEGGTA